MMAIYFITGYPGFLASSLIRQLIQDHPNIEHINLLVLPHLREQAENEMNHFAKSTNLHDDLFTIISGDITKPNLGMKSEFNNELQQSITHVFHLAAVYDLAVPKEIAQNVNINGTKEMNKWVLSLHRLERYIYFSTAYVSGTRCGKIYEHDLNKGQTFKNHYEQTKYEAELLVEKLKSRVPVTIIRPGITKGNSSTGKTIKFDGLYFFLNFLDHLSFLPIIPYLGNSEAEGNFVSVDYVLQATSFLSIAPIGTGKTYHLTDPNPYSMNQIQKMLSEAYLGKTPKGTIPIPLVKYLLSSASLRKWLHVEMEVMDYFTTYSSYDCSEATQDLEGSGINCPNFKDTIEPMIQFYRKYKHDRTKHIPII